MDFTYWLLLFTFLANPIIAFILAEKTKYTEIRKYKKWIYLFFILHNILFVFGLTLRGDYVDYFIFSIEYFIICFTILSMNELKSTAFKTLKLLGIVGIAIGVLVGLVGIILFIVLTMDLESDKKFIYTSDNKNYETRRYSFGFATLENTRYTFETYRIFGLLPIEYKIDKTDFFDNKTNLEIGEDNLKFEIKTIKNSKSIEFISTNGKTFTKNIK